MNKNEIAQKIYAVIKAPHLSNSATLTEDGKPWTRYVVAIGTEDLTIRFSSYLDARKISQLKKNPEIHLTCGAENAADMNPYIQVQGIATVSTDKDERHTFWNPSLEPHFSGPEDPNYAVIIVKPYRIEYNSLDSKEPLVWEK